jgi:hypothetical protein
MVERLVDLTGPPRLPTSLAGLTPRGRNVSDVGELGDKGIDSGVNASWGVEWFRGELESFGLRSNKVPIHRVPTPAWRFGGSLAAFRRRNSDLNKLGTVVGAFIA